MTLTLSDPKARRWRQLAATAALLLPATHAMALGREVPVGEFFADAPQQITWVATCGEWDAAGIAGFYRVVHAERHAQSFLYVQWMYRTADGSLAVMETAALPEINNDHADVLLDKVQCRSVKEGIVVSAAASFGHENTEGRVQVRAFFQPGAYRYARVARGAPSRVNR